MTQAEQDKSAHSENDDLIPDVMRLEEIAIEKVLEYGRGFSNSLAAMYKDGNLWDAHLLANMVMGEMPEEVRAIVCFQGLRAKEDKPHRTMNFASQTMALRIAHDVGPNWADWLQRFAKLVVKFAQQEET